jgi:hypothetical protein
MKQAEETLPVVLPFVPLPSAETMPEEFAYSTMLALRTQQEILEMTLNPNDEHYEAELRAKSAMAAAQINAQLKADEQRLKRQIAAVSYYAELKAALAAFHAKKD